ncbi:MAG: homogentisate phytyltransferase/homogentisate geranylgeranyltransferase [Halieaceae bacterium]|jgi:homogentisate phytyltransferase/homogentisate geranylgeranyltransferase
MLVSIWKFTRPHAFIGTLAAIIGLYVIVLAQSEQDTFAPGMLLQTLAACLAAAVFIVGYNQYHDLEIDRINKPELPYAAGELTRTQVLTILGLCLATALLLALLAGGWLLATVASSLLIGAAYSAPFTRLKKSSLWAAACILAVRGPIINVGLYLHFSTTLTGSDDVPGSIWLLVILTLLFALVIAWSKDIPDTQGDARFGVETLVMRLGPDFLFRIGRWILTAAFAFVMLAGAGPWLPELDGRVLAATQGLLLAALWLRSRGVNPHDNDAIKPYYLFIWNLFQLEYLAFPLATLAV